MNGAILIAEDHEVARKSIQQFLQQHDYRVEEAMDGEAAIDAINNSNFDLVITDYVALSGLACREFSGFGSIPVWLLP